MTIAEESPLPVDPQPLDRQARRRADAPLGWRITIVCSMVALLETTAAGMVGGALTDIQDTFDLSDTLAGLIPTAAIGGSLVAVIPSAQLADRRKRVWVLGGAALAWILLVVGSAAATVFALFLFTRVLLGAAAQLNNPAASSLIADAHPARSRARAYGYERALNYLGLPLGIGVGAALSSAFGWRTAFVLLAIPGVLALLAIFTLKEPKRGFSDAAEGSTVGMAADLASEEQADARPPTIDQARKIWAIPTMRTLLVGVPVLFSALASLFFWSTSYFQEVHGLEEASAGGIAGGVGGTGIMIGIIIGSRLGDRHHGKKPGWRLRLAGGALLACSVAFTGFVLLPSLVLQAACFGLANVFIAMAIPSLTAAVADVVPAAMRGAGFSSVQFLIALGSAAGPPIVGATSDALGSLRPAMAVLLVPLAISGFWVLRGSNNFDADALAVLAPSEPNARAKKAL